MNINFSRIILSSNLTRGCLLVLLVFCFSSGSLWAQITKRDSLLRLVNQTSIPSNIYSKDTLYIHNLTMLAAEYRYQNLDSLLTLSQESLKLSKEVNFLNGEINSYSNIGEYYSDMGQTKQAISYLKKAYNLADHNKVQDLKVETLNELSLEYSYQGNYPLALKGYLDAIEIAEELGFKSLLSIINDNIAQLYRSHEDFNQAMVFYKKSKALNEEIGDPIFSAETLCNMASTYVDMNELEYAMFNVNNAISIFEKEKILDWLAYCYEVKGNIYLNKGKNTWALYWFKQSELLHIKIGDDRGKIGLFNGMSEAYTNIKKDSIAEIYSLEAYQLSKNLEYLSGIKNSAYQLFKIYKNKNDYEKSLWHLEVFQNTSESLTKKSNEKTLSLLKAKMEYDQQKQQLISQNEKALAKHNSYIYVFIIILIIFFIIVLIVRRNERIQKKLNLELLSNKKNLEEKQAYLNELNQTKNKLFSIIGHDLRGPIGAFQGLLKLFKEGEMTKDEFLDFVPKLKVDIDSISFTLNNLLSWGQTQMNGSTTRPTTTNLDEIVEDNMALLSEIAESKSIKLINRVEADCKIWSDTNQIDIIIRNLLSNALKFTPNNGQIIIGAIQKLKTCEIYVKDNGMGMTEETIGKIFQKDSNHTTYGTNAEKGTGLGLSLCKEMIEKNKGKIWVHSALGKGSSFYFTMPRVIEPIKKSA